MHTHTPPEKSSRLHPGQTAGSVVDLSSLALAASPGVSDLCDLVEFRADALHSQVPELQAAMASCPLPALLTVRVREEGGITPLSREERDKIFAQLLPFSQFVDVEIAHLNAFPEIISGAKSRGITVVASFHDFTGTPDLSFLEDLLAQATAAGADAVKFATTLRHTADLATLAHLQETVRAPLATMGMGPLGRVSRLLLASLGSVLNYGYLDQPTIPGQWPAQRLRELIRELRDPR